MLLYTASARLGESVKVGKSARCILGSIAVALSLCDCGKARGVDLTVVYGPGVRTIAVDGRTAQNDFTFSELKTETPQDPKRTEMRIIVVVPDELAGRTLQLDLQGLDVQGSTLAAKTADVLIGNGFGSRFRGRGKGPLRHGDACESEQSRKECDKSAYHHILLPGGAPQFE